MAANGGGASSANAARGLVVDWEKSSRAPPIDPGIGRGRQAVTGFAIAPPIPLRLVFVAPAAASGGQDR